VKYGGEKVKESPRRDGRFLQKETKGTEKFFRGKTSLRKALRKAGREEGMSKGRGVNHRDAEN
jgi:hypothetical protein